MDPLLSINGLRSTFLQQSSDIDQTRRLIKPYSSGSYSVDEQIRELYTDDDGKNLLTELESPPISKNYLDKYPTLRKDRYEKGPMARSRSISSSSRKSNEDVGRTVTQIDMKLPDDSLNTLRLDSNTAHPPHRTVLNRTTSSTLKSNSSAGSAEFEVQKSKTKRRSSLPFSKIFRNHSDSGRTTEHDRNRPKPPSQHKTKFSFYDTAFNFDENIEEDDDDDDDDDDDAKDNENFFNQDISQHSGSTSTKNSKSIKKSNFPLNPQNILLNSDSKLNTSEQHGDGASLASKTESYSYSTGEKQRGESDIESYINEEDLKDLDLDAEQITDSDLDEQLDKDVHPTSSAIIEDSTSLGSSDEGYDGANGDDISSYGKSLLDSDFSDHDFDGDNKPHDGSSSLIDDSMINDELFHDGSIAAHSIPSTRAFHMLKASDSTSKSSFDRPDYKIQPSKMMSSTASSIKESITSSSMSKKASSRSHSITTSTFVKPRNSFSSMNNEQLKLPLTKSTQKHKRSTSDSKSIIKPRRLTPEPLIIKKIDVPKHPSSSASQLSSLFCKNKKETSNPLEYFSFVSAKSVVKFESMALSIYIQASKTYQRNPFTLKVRKSATVFEVIGYILYCYSTDKKPASFDEDGLTLKDISNPNNFVLKIVDEDGEPFEDNFGTLERKKEIGTIFDNEVVLCKVGNDNQFKLNEKMTPLPYETHGESPQNDDGVKFDHTTVGSSTDAGINQLSYYKPIIPSNSTVNQKHEKLVEIKVFLYPNVNPQFNFTPIKASVNAKINDILIQYCKMKGMDPNDYALKLCGQLLYLDLNETVGELDGNYSLELITKKDVRALNLKKLKKHVSKPSLPTIQSAGVTPITLDLKGKYLKDGNGQVLNGDEPLSEQKSQIPHNQKKHSKYKLGLSKQISSGNSSVGGGSFFKLKNSSKSSLQNSTFGGHFPSSEQSNLNLDGNYKDLFAGAYYKYKVWRRQQMSFINKHERTLAIDGDYIYIIPPENGYHWHNESIKTKCFHISQVSIAKRSKRVPEYFKIFVNRPGGIKRYYFEAVSPQECVEIVTRIQNLLGAYKMNHK